MGLLIQQPAPLCLPRSNLRGRSDRLSALVVWCAYTVLLAIVISNHEPWFDEAQAWLLARDVSLPQLVTHYLRYEGSPGLWHYLLALPAQLGFPYRTMSWLAGCIASAGVLVFLWEAPFPKWIRYLFPFTFFMFYQYAAVARSYALLPLLLFSIAVIYRRAGESLLLFVVLAVLLANVSLHGFLLAFVLAAVLVLRTFQIWPQLAPAARLQHVAAGSALLLMALLIILQLRRPPDLIGFGILNFSIKHLVAVSVLKLRDAFTGIFLLSAPFLGVSAWWFHRQGTLFLFLLGTGALLTLAGVAYSNVWHEGSLVLWWTFVMWISWPESASSVPRPVFACWVVLLAIQLFWSAQASWFDIRFSYSGSKELAGYIQSHQLYHHRIFAFGPKSAAILPYFRQGIFANWPKEQSFWLWSRDNKIESSFADIPFVRPEFVILSVTRDAEEDVVKRRQSLRDQKYQLSRRFDGVLYWKSWVLEGDSYELYKAAPI